MKKERCGACLKTQYLSSSGLTQKTTQKIIEAITKKSDITQKELAAVIGITEDRVKYHIIRLRKKGVLKRIGPDKGGYWEVVKK